MKEVVQAGDMEKHLSEIPKDRVIAMVSNHANRVGRPADLLQTKGFNVAGGVGVQTEGGKLTKIEPPKPFAK